MHSHTHMVTLMVVPTSGNWLLLFGPHTQTLTNLVWVHLRHHHNIKIFIYINRIATQRTHDTWPEIHHNYNITCSDVRLGRCHHIFWWPTTSRRYCTALSVGCIAKREREIAERNERFVGIWVLFSVVCVSHGNEEEEKGNEEKDWSNVICAFRV